MTIEQAAALNPGDQFKATGNVWEDPVYTVKRVDEEGTVFTDDTTGAGPSMFSARDLEGYSLLGDVPVAPKKK